MCVVTAPFLKGSVLFLNEPCLKVNIAGVELKNPVITGSGTFGFGKEYGNFFDLSQLGGICVKGLTIEERQGNPPPRIAETPSGILNSVGLQNPGIARYLDTELLRLRQYDTVIIANISGNTVEEYCEMAAMVSGSSTDMVEMNISCPNVKQGGVAFGTDPDMVLKITEKVRACCTKPLIVKLSPNVTDITLTAKAAKAGGADAISLINTITGMAIDYKTRRPILKNNIGGLSGPAVKPVALRMVWQVYNTVDLPIIGMGGICTFEDAIEFMLAGASAVAIGTYQFIAPTAAVAVVEGLRQYCIENEIENISSIVGKLEIW